MRLASSKLEACAQLLRVNGRVSCANFKWQHGAAAPRASIFRRNSVHHCSASVREMIAVSLLSRNCIQVI